jgi:hypothetical protein
MAAAMSRKTWAGSDAPATAEVTGEGPDRRARKDVLHILLDNVSETERLRRAHLSCSCMREMEMTTVGTGKYTNLSHY